MSIFDFATVWQTSRAQGNNLLVHLALAEMAVDGEAHASRTQIGNLARCSHDTVARAIDHLIGIRAIEVTEYNAGPRAARYTLLYDTAQVADLLRVAEPERAQTTQPAEFETYQTARQKDPIPQIAEVAGISAETEGALYPGQPVDAVPFLPPPSIPDATPGAQAAAHEQILAATGIAPVDHLAGLQALLAALGVKPHEDLPFYWFRAEHTEDYKALLADMECTIDDLLLGVTRQMIRAPDLRSIQELRLMLIVVNFLPA